MQDSILKKNGARSQTVSDLFSPFYTACSYGKPGMLLEPICYSSKDTANGRNNKTTLLSAACGGL